MFGLWSVNFFLYNALQLLQLILCESSGVFLKIQLIKKCNILVTVLMFGLWSVNFFLMPCLKMISAALMIAVRFRAMMI